MQTLLLGCGNSRERKIIYDDLSTSFDDLTTIDMNPDCNPDILMDLNTLSTIRKALPFEDGCFDEIAAYDFLEHIGEQGDWRGFFNEFAEYHRVLKPGGIMGILVPVGPDALADPGHKRFFSNSHFCFLSQKFYAEALGKGDAVTDYRWYWKKDFRVKFLENNGHHIGCLLEKLDDGNKP